MEYAYSFFFCYSGNIKSGKSFWNWEEDREIANLIPFKIFYKIMPCGGQGLDIVEHVTMYTQIPMSWRQPGIAMLADVILVIHFLFILFVIGSLPLIWLGAWLEWEFVRNPWFRFTHLAAILFVVGESLLGTVCPLTLLEDSLRHTATVGSFIQRWLHRIVFYDVSEWILTTIYVLFALLVAITFRLLPPRHRRPPPSSV